jgi:hypothetical protein
MQETKEILKNHRLPLLEHYKAAKVYEERSVWTLETVKVRSRFKGT